MPQREATVPSVGERRYFKKGTTNLTLFISWAQSAQQLRGVIEGLLFHQGEPDCRVVFRQLESAPSNPDNKCWAGGQQIDVVRSPSQRTRPLPVGTKLLAQCLTCTAESTLDRVKGCDDPMPY